MGRPKIWFDVIICYPELIPEWNFEANTSFMVYRSQTVHWLCEKERHPYTSSISARARGRGCPYCKIYRLLTGVNDLATVNPALASEWDHSKNRVSPSQVLYKNNTKYWWICSFNHSWEDTVNHRNAGRGCPYCSNHRAWAGYNDLLTMEPTLCLEWDYTKNENGPETYVHKSSKYVWWLCKNNHSWRATIGNRVNGRGCKLCSGAGSSRGERALSEILKRLGYEVKKNRSILKSKDGKFLEIDIWMENKNVAIEYNGHYYHCETCNNGVYDRHEEKIKSAEDKGVTLLVVWESEFLRDPVKTLFDLVKCIESKTIDENFTYGAFRDICCKTIQRELGKNYENNRNEEHFIETVFQEISMIYSIEV